MPYTTEEMRRREGIIRQFQRGQITAERAAGVLGCHRQHVYRLATILAERGSLKQPGHPAPNTVPEDMEESILHCFDANPRRNNAHIVDLLAEKNIQTNRMTVRRVLLRNGRKKEAAPPPAYIRFEHDAIGSLVYQDTSDHEWMLGSGTRVRCIAGEDDHSRKLLFARFFQHDGVWQNMTAMRSVTETYGLPQTFFVDRASHFSGNERRSIYVTSKHPETWEIQIKRALESLGVGLSRSTAYHPESKGKIERLFGFMQERLPHEVGNSALPEANRTLTAWKHWYNHTHVHSETGMTPEKRWQTAIQKKRSLWIPIPPSVNLDDAFSFHDRRTIRKDNTFSYQGETYHLTGVGGQYIGREVELHVLPPKTLRIFWLGTFVCELPFQGTFEQPID